MKQSGHFAVLSFLPSHRRLVIGLGACIVLLSTLCGCNRDAAPPAQSQAPLPPSAGSSPSPDKLPKAVPTGSRNSSPGAR
jgi:hypothetical protein